MQRIVQLFGGRNRTPGSVFGSQATANAKGEERRPGPCGRGKTGVKRVLCVGNSWIFVLQVIL